jgi:hypothetical protein
MEMSFWKRKKPSSDEVPGPTDAGQAQKAKKKSKRSPPVAMELKILAIEALDVASSLGFVFEWLLDERAGEREGGLSSCKTLSPSRRPVGRANAELSLCERRDGAPLFWKKRRDSGVGS